MNDLLQDLQQLPDAVLLGGAVLAALFILLLIVILFVVLRRRARQPEPVSPDLRIDVASLPAHGPPEGGPRLEFYGTPVRLAVLVLRRRDATIRSLPKVTCPPCWTTSCRVLRLSSRRIVR